MIQTDDLDEAIIAIFRTDGRLSNREVARRLDISEGTVRQRLKKLQDANAIRIGVVADVFHLGYTQAALIRLAIAPQHVEAALAALTALEDTTYVAAVAGRFNLIVLVLVRDQAHLLDLINSNVESLQGINEVDVRPVVRTVKYNFHEVAIR